MAQASEGRSEERFLEVNAEALAPAILRWFIEARPSRSAPAQRHITAPPQRWPWLPTLEHHHLAQHPFCGDCGGVKYVGSLKATPMGGLINRAASLRDRLTAEGRKVTEAQFRLIVKRLETLEADDTFLHSRQTQEVLLVESFARYTHIDKTALESYLRSC